MNDCQAYPSPFAPTEYQFESVRSFFACTHVKSTSVLISELQLLAGENDSRLSATAEDKLEVEKNSVQEGSTLHNPYLAELARERARRPVSACPFRLLNESMMQAEVDGLIWLRPIAIAAHRGQIKFARDPELLNESLSLFLYKAFTGETSVFGVAQGRGRIYLANGTHRIFFVYLDNEVINLQGTAVLAFEDSLEHKVQMIGNAAGLAVGGMYSLRLEGHGWVAFCSCGWPVALPCNDNEPLTCSPIKALAWSGRAELKVQVDVSRMNLMNRGVADIMQITFTGGGFVAIHGDEEYMYPKMK